MAEQVNVKPNPIQRNAFDVATELTYLYYETHAIGDLDEMRETFLKFYATANMANRVHFRYLKEYLPDDLKELAEKF